jgi:hypothetical protein
MRQFLVLIVCVCTIAAIPAKADVLLSNFNDFVAEGPEWEGSWTNGSVPQYIQNTGFISIAPVGSGNPNPADDGQVSVDYEDFVDITGLEYISLTARSDSGNATPVLQVRMVSFDGTGFRYARANFTSASFSSSFTTQIAPLVQDSNFDPTLVVGWQIGGPELDGENSFRMSFDNAALMEATPIPEVTLAPLTWALLVFVCAMYRRRRLNS